ncbi:aldehyde dehydrogenase family protein [Streptomyces sp. BBFR2]|uniref:aldehyde dehydrogenase family protein n=1 Tax=Streptomyces sp. BBFR2 TaxID=3372854 RepID=UPI0037D9A449
MRTYRVHIAGEELDGKGFVHVPNASALLTDPLSVLTRKGELDAGGNPADQEPAMAGRVALATDEQIHQALRAAREAQPVWAAAPLARRISLMAAFRQAVLDNFDELVELLGQEGHPPRLARWELSGIVNSAAPESLERLSSLMESRGTSGDREIRLVRKADGVVCLSPPKNAALSNGCMGLWALVAGNALVVGAPRSAPLGVAHIYQRIVAPILESLGAPPGVLSVVCAPTVSLLSTWLESDDVDDIYYFGSAERGRQVGIDCFTRGKKPVLELSGNDGALVWRDAETDLAARALAECFHGAGQICMVPRYALAHPDIADQLIGRLADEARAVRPGLPDDPEVVTSPVLRKEEFLAAVRQCTDAGATLVTGGYMTGLDGSPDPDGFFAAPTVVRIDGLAAARELTAVTEETFFPLMCVVVPTPEEAAAETPLLDQALGFLNRNAYGLRNSLWAQDPEVIEEVVSRLSNGGLLKINDSHTGFVPQLPTHGGTGLTSGPFGEGALPSLHTSHLQGISIATGVSPRSAVFDLGV